MNNTEPEVPMELVGVHLPDGDLDYMAQCLIEEYMLLGWDEKQMLTLFTHPAFHTTHRIYQDKGEDYVRALIRQVRDEWSPGHIEGGKSDA